MRVCNIFYLLNTFHLLQFKILIWRGDAGKIETRMLLKILCSTRVQYRLRVRAKTMADSNYWHSSY